jgi:hypothetical protein
MKTTRSATAALLALSLAACLATPIGKPGAVPLDPLVVDEWKCTNLADEGETARLGVYRFDRSQYLVEWTQDDKTARYRGFPGRIGGRMVVNLIELEEDERSEPWAVVRYQVRADRSLVVDSLDMEQDEKVVRKALERRPADPSLWKPFASCVVEGQPGPSPTP